MGAQKTNGERGFNKLVINVITLCSTLVLASNRISEASTEAYPSPASCAMVARTRRSVV